MSAEVMDAGGTAKKAFMVNNPPHNKIMDSLPIDSSIPELRRVLGTSPSVVVQAPPGAGKTTRIPLALLDHPCCAARRIVMLEPRRIAAVSAARWMARTLGEEVGRTIGYAIRFERRISEKTRVEVVTEGILARRIQADPTLEGISLIIFDEFHERSIHADLALALCLDIQRNLREDLKLLVMSATLNTGPLAALLGNAPVIASQGKMHPVEEQYLPDIPGRSLAEKVASAVQTALVSYTGDILVFLPGAGEIRSCSEELQKKTGRIHRDVEIHPLYGDLPFEAQEAAILPSLKRKVILATNIAETSLTVEGIGVVIDSGLTRRLRFDPSRGMNRLITLPVSRASAEQRKGRAGRLGPGICIRLYSRHAFQAMIPFAPAELLVSDLSSVVLELAEWGIRDPAQLSWLDLPPQAAWDSARDLLIRLGALDGTGAVTPRGREMARFPLHPRLGSMLIRGVETGVPGLASDLAAVLSERDIIRRKGRGQTAYAQTRDIRDRLETLHAWRKEEFVPGNADPWAVRTVDRTAGLLKRIASGSGGNTGKNDDPETISRLLLTAFPDRLARLREEGGGRFLLSGGRGVRLPVNDPCASSRFIVAAEVDAGEKAEGMVYLAAGIPESVIRHECGKAIESLRKVFWDRRQKKVIAVLEERIGALVLSSKAFNPSDDEAVPILCEEIHSDPDMLSFNREARQFQARVGLMKRTFPQDGWPDLSEEQLAADPEVWLSPWLGSIRSAEELQNLDLLPALKACLSFDRLRILDRKVPAHLTVPSGHRIQLDYCSGDFPVLAVKVQEMFGLADTPEIAGGKVRVLLHLLSPARRPVQVTHDLKGFWDRGYPEVKKELKGRYPKHPWPDDPWSAQPTARTKKAAGRPRGG